MKEQASQAEYSEFNDIIEEEKEKVVDLRPKSANVVLSKSKMLNRLRINNGERTHED